MINVTKEAIIDYLLGKLNGDKEDDFLAACFSTDENVQKYELVREDLIESYLRGNLSEDDKERFKSHFLEDYHNRELFEFAKTLRKSLGENKQLEAIAMAKTAKKRLSVGNWLVPASAFGALLIGGVLIWQLVLKSAEQERAEINPLPDTMPTPKISQKTAPSQTPIVNVSPSIANNSIKENSTEPSPIVTPSPTRIPNRDTRNTFLAFTLPLGSKGEDEKLKISKQHKTIRLETIKPDESYPQYRVKIVKIQEDETEGRVILNTEVKRFPTDKSGETIYINVPAGGFEDGDYKFVVYGVNADKTTKELKGTQSVFTVEREK